MHDARVYVCLFAPVCGGQKWARARRSSRGVRDNARAAGTPLDGARSPAARSARTALLRNTEERTGDVALLDLSINPPGRRRRRHRCRRRRRRITAADDDGATLSSTLTVAAAVVVVAARCVTTRTT